MVSAAVRPHLPVPSDPRTCIFHVGHRLRPCPGSELAGRYEALTEMVQAAQIASLTERPTSELAARRAEAVDDARNAPTAHLRMLRSEVDRAQASFEVAIAAPQPDANPHEGVARARAELDAAQARLGHAIASQQEIRSNERTVENIDAALTPRISSAVESPATYITDILGDRPAKNADRWDKSAKAIETYRHATLGIEPSTGALDEVPSIGAKPETPLQAEAWSSVSSSIAGIVQMNPGIRH